MSSHPRKGTKCICVSNFTPPTGTTNPTWEKCPLDAITNSHFSPQSLPPLRMRDDANALFPWLIQGISRKCGLILWTQKDNLIKIWYQNISTFPQILVICLKITLQLGQNVPPGVAVLNVPTPSSGEQCGGKPFLQSYRHFPTCQSLLWPKPMTPREHSTDGSTGYSKLTQSQKHLCPPFPLFWKIPEH